MEFHRLKIYKMKRYEHYKDSGIEWLGKVPKHWEALKMKYAFRERVTKGFPNEPLLSATQQYGVIPQSIYENRTVVATKGLETLKLVLCGDFIISLRSFQGGIEYAHYKGIISPAYTVLEPKQIHKDYFRYLGKSDIYIQLLKSCVTGIREGQNIDYSVLKENYLPIPSLSEQQAIADYLDAKCEQIDRAVAQKVRVIELLNERRQIIVQRAVTRGLNPNTTLKDSGIDWIGQIPEHWEVKRLKNCMKLNPSLDIENVYKDTLVSFMPMECLRNAAIILKEAKYSDVKTYTPFRSEDIVMAKVTPCFENGNIAIANNLTNGMGFGSSEIFVIRCNNNTNNRFLFYHLQSSYIKNLGIASMTGTGGLKRVNPDDICRSIIFLPPHAEQRAIADYLDGVNEKIDRAINIKREEITRLKEYRKILINSAVTGKVRI